MGDRRVGPEVPVPPNGHLAPHPAWGIVSSRRPVPAAGSPGDRAAPERRTPLVENAARYGVTPLTEALASSTATRGSRTRWPPREPRAPAGRTPISLVAKNADLS